MMTTWLEEARRLSVVQVAEALGLEVVRLAQGNPTYPCPSCGDTTRHRRSHDKRGAIGLTSNGMGWQCHQCEVKGDAIDLAALTLEGARFPDLSPDKKDRVKEWFCERWSGIAIGDKGSVMPRRGVRAQGAPRARFKPIPRPPEPAPNYPPLNEVMTLWNGSKYPDEDAEVEDYLRSRALNPTAMIDLVRAIPKGASTPPWAAMGERSPWTKTGHRLISPLFDSHGTIRSLRARSVRGLKPKSVPPWGDPSFQVKGLVLANPLAVQVLKSGGLPDWWDYQAPFKIVIAEGEPDFWTFATGPEASSEIGGLACFGLFNGLLPLDVAQKLPRRSIVIIAEQEDDPKDDGKPTTAESYTERILSILDSRRRAGELTVKKVRP